MSSKPKVGSLLRVNAIDLSDHDHDWFVVMSRVTPPYSVRGKLASVVGFFVRRNKAAYVEIITHTAEKHGISFEECFHRLLTKQPLPDARFETIDISEEDDE